MKSFFLVLVVFLLCAGGVFYFMSKGDHLRGTAEKSTDGKTYLAIVDDNGGGCGPIFVGGKQWQYKLNEPGPISPGLHTIKCGGEIKLAIPAGTVFRFDYWGP